VKKESSHDIDKTWRILMEGALFEGRCGNRKEARDQFNYVLKKCRNYGPVFVEASKYEERENEISEAIDICELGLEYNAKYNPLWFQYLRLYEKASEQMRNTKFEKFHFIVQDMFQNVSKEFYWKINVELA
jgi:tetratricopeptide (TPR) repeat protein